MTEKLSVTLEEAAEERFGRIVGAITLSEMPDLSYMPEDVPEEFIDKLVGLELPIRGKILGARAGILVVGNTIVESLQFVHDRDITVPVYGFDAFAEMDKNGLSADADKWAVLGAHVLEFPAHSGTLTPLPRLLAA